MGKPKDSCPRRSENLKTDTAVDEILNMSIVQPAKLNATARDFVLKALQTITHFSRTRDNIFFSFFSFRKQTSHGSSIVPIQHGTPEHARAGNPVPPYHFPVSEILVLFVFFFKPS